MLLIDLLRLNHNHNNGITLFATPILVCEQHIVPTTLKVFKIGQVLNFLTGPVFYNLLEFWRRS